MTIIPNNNRILLEKIETSNNVGGLILPAKTDQKSFKAKIIEVSNKIGDYDFKAGEIVFVPNWAGTIVDNNLIIIKAEEILGKEK